MPRRPDWTFEWNQAAYEQGMKRRQVVSAMRAQNGMPMAEDIRTLRAAKIIDLSVQGLSQNDIARTMGMHVNTIQRELAWARKQGLVRDLEAKMLHGTIPAALAAIDETLASGSAALRVKAADIALKLFKTFSDQSAAKDMQPQSTEGDPLDTYWESMRQKAVTVTSLAQQALPDGRDPDPAADPLHLGEAPAAGVGALPADPAPEAAPAAGPPAGAGDADADPD